MHKYLGEYMLLCVRVTMSSYVTLQEHEDYELIQYNNPELNKAIVHVNIFHEHRQTIQVCATTVIYMLLILVTTNFSYVFAMA